MAMVFWFVVWLPMREERKVRDFQAGLTKDDAVVLGSGIHARIVQVDAETVVVEVADRVRLTVERSAVARRQSAPAAT